MTEQVPCVNYFTGYTRRNEVIERRQLFLRAVVGVEAILNLAVPGEVERPANGVADDIGRETAIEGSYVAFILHDVTGDAEGISKTRGGSSVDCCSIDAHVSGQNCVVGVGGGGGGVVTLQASFHNIERVHCESGYDTSCKAGYRLHERWRQCIVGTHGPRGLYVEALASCELG